MLERVFIVGTARSGTTLLRNLLGSHSDVISFSESKFFTVLKKNSVLGFVTPRVQKRILKFIQKQPGSHQKKIDTNIPHFFREKSIVAFFLNLLDQLADDYGAKIWVEKTPEHLHVIPLIKKYAPNAKFIHIQRNSADVIASLYKRSRGKWNSPLKIDDCIQRCIRDREIEKLYIDKPNHFFISYEELCINTSPQLQKLCSYIGLDFEEKMLRDYKIVQAEIAPHSTGRYHEKILKPIQNQNGKTFDKVFSEEEKTYVLDSLKRVGY